MATVLLHSGAWLGGTQGPDCHDSLNDEKQTMRSVKFGLKRDSVMVSVGKIDLEPKSG